MDVDRIPGRTCGPPFPVHERLVDSLAPGHPGGGTRLPQYSAAEHRPHHYIAELRPKNRVTELGD